MTAKQTQEEQWDVVSEPRTTIEFDTVGDEWEGFFEGRTVIHNDNTNEDYDYLIFRDSDGNPFQISASYDLNRAFQKISEGTYVRIRLMELKPMSKGNDLKLYKVMTRR